MIDSTVMFIYITHKKWKEGFTNITVHIFFQGFEMPSFTCELRGMERMKKLHEHPWKWGPSEVSQIRPQKSLFN